MALTLYHSPDSRSSRIIWLLEELRLPYELRYTDIPRRRGTGAPDPTNPHPDRRVPALVHDETLVTEGAAICIYLSDLATTSDVAVRMGDPRWASYLTWVAFYAGEIEPAFTAKIAGQTEHDRWAAQAFERVIHRVVSTLEQGPYLLGDKFSPADILVSGPFEWYAQFVPANSVVAPWLERLLQRPAALRWFEKDDWPPPSKGLSALDRAP